MCSSRNSPGSEQYTKEFIRNVDAVLKQHNGEFVEDFEVKFELSNELIIHLDKWVKFAAASQAKNLALDLMPVKARGQYDQYLLPHELLGSASTRRLLNIQLRFVSIELPSKFSGFPNLRKLDLHFVDIVAKDLLLMLSSCSSLEWLSMVLCHVGDELTVDLPLPWLQYLCVAYCGITRMKFNATKLKTFVCRGSLCPFDLTQSLELKDAHFHVDDLSLTLDYALVTLPTMLPSVENFSLRANTPLKPPTLLERAWKFSQLKYLLLELCMNFEDEGSIVSLASYLRTVFLHMFHFAPKFVLYLVTKWYYIFSFRLFYSSYHIVSHSTSCVIFCLARVELNYMFISSLDQCWILFSDVCITQSVTLTLLSYLKNL